ncbi:phage tail tube protein [Nocardioides bruguierae]|uniref:Major tail protein n=1 Tax=Nocardioides bruguierae TaxID=2945102 RepID=A0A9X2IHL1_9ACTN|nr:hypothetical protein [Nocardioides bruguierae]MCM0622719.1 hypothetical protein [Nocardioides bruguierae]
MPVLMPDTTSSFGSQSLVILTSEPASLTAITAAEVTAGDNITCHMVGDWWPTAATAKVSKQRKMCQTKTATALGETTWDTPTLMYTYNPQSVGTPGADGNEAYEALAEGTTVWLVQRLGKSGTSDLAAADAYRVIPVELGPQVPGTSADDAGGEFVISQEVAFADGHDAPVDGVIAA